MAEYQRKALPLVVSGVNYTAPVDRMPTGKFRALENVRAMAGGYPVGRPGMQFVFKSGPYNPNPVHSISRLNDPVPTPLPFSQVPPTLFNTWLRLVGIGNHAYWQIYNNQDIVNNQITFLPENFSGYPLALLEASSEFTPRPFMVIGDSLRMRKILSSVQCYNLGIAPPNWAPTAVDTGTGVGPDSSGQALNYTYLFTCRAASDIKTGCVSSPGPAMRVADAVVGTGHAIQVTNPTAHPDPQVFWLDVYRFGGSLPQWIWIGQVQNASGSTMLDIFPDDTIVGNPLLNIDPDGTTNDDQPFTSIDVPRRGICDVTSNGPGQGGTLTLQPAYFASSNPWQPYDPVNDNPYNPAGTQIIVGGQFFTFYRAPDSTSSVEILEDCTNATAVPYQMPNPELMHVPMQFVWGPFGGGFTGLFMFACGDPYRQGAVYWTTGNRMESHSGKRVLDVTGSSEPLQNGFMYDGRSYVFSTERLFQMLPSFGESSEFIALEVPNGKGLYARWALTGASTTVGPKVWFMARDGIYEFTGGTPVSITDQDLYPLFQHEEAAVQTTPDGVPPSFVNIDFTYEVGLRLVYIDGFLKFYFRDCAGDSHCWVYNVETKAWVSMDTTTPQTCYEYSEVGRDILQLFIATNTSFPLHSNLIGTVDGQLMTWGGTSDNGAPIAGRIRTGADDLGDYRPRKLIGDLMLDYDSNCEALDVVAGFENWTYQTIIDIDGAGVTGRRRDVGDINSGLGQIAANIGLDVTWTSTVGFPKLYFWEPAYVIKPELTDLRATDWSDDGYQGAKFVQGAIIEADTLGQDRTVQIQGDAGQVFVTLTINHNGQIERAYPLAADSWTPFTTHNLRLVPLDAGDFWRLFKVKWVWEPAPESVTEWITQNTTLDQRGFFFHRDAIVAYNSVTPVVWLVRVDGTDYTYNLPSSGGAWIKQYLPLQPMKGKMVQVYSLKSSAPWQLSQRDSEVRLRSWGAEGPFDVKMPFGGLSRVNGAAI